jgi:hypothetical protein
MRITVATSWGLRRQTFKIHRTIILPVVFYRCETWSAILRKEHRLRVSENRMLGKMLGSKKEKVIQEWRKWHNEDLHDIYSSPNTIRLF